MDVLIEQLRNIPFLELDIDIDLPKLIEEYQALSNKYEFKDYRTNFWQVRRKYRKAWSGISLISSDGSLYKDMYERPLLLKEPSLDNAIAFVRSIT